ncbi:LysR family transcriptional regulator [Rhodobacteraceae bacterium NNCM2]|nr:LysR family transcriptional regulator [Coraliihabitans acroporae]
MNLRAVDLNLLVVLDALLDEAHVSRAAKRLNMSQPAVSSALQRCRELFRDPLLERGKGVMTPTPRAASLRAPLKTLLAEARALIDPPPVPLAKLQQVVRITVADDPVVHLASSLTSALDRSAPGIAIVFCPWRGAAGAIESLRNGDTEIAISVFDTVEAEIEYDTLIDEDYIVVMRAGHPAAEGFDRESWLSSPHVVVSGRGERRTPLDGMLERKGLRRRVGLVLPSFQLVPRVVATTDYMAMVPRHSLAFYDESAFAVFDPPIPAEGFTLRIAWHSRRAGDTGTLHVVDTIRAIFRDLDRDGGQGAVGCRVRGS